MLVCFSFVHWFLCRVHDCKGLLQADQQELMQAKENADRGFDEKTWEARGSFYPFSSKYEINFLKNHFYCLSPEKFILAVIQIVLR